MRRMLIVVALATLLVLSIVGPAAAGEITRNGDRPMAVGGSNETGWILHAKSACAFSGLNDEWVLGIEDELFGQTQNWGQIPAELRKAVRAGNSPDPHLVPPNVGCNPSLGDH